MVPKEKTDAKMELDDMISDIERKIKSFKSLDQPKVEWRLYALLNRLGLTKYEILAYIALVEARTPLTIRELIGKESRTGIPQPRAYDVLGSLIKYGLVEESKGEKANKSKMYRAIPPEDGLDNLLEFFVYAKEESIKLFKENMGSIEQPYGGIWEVKSQNLILGTAKRIARKAQHEILIVANIEFVTMLLATLKTVFERKKILISVIICLKSEDNIENIFDWFSFMRVRERKLFLMPYLIVDRKYALFWSKKSSFKKRSRNAIGQEIENKEIIETLIDHFFYTNWQTAKILTDDLSKELNRKYPLTLCNILTALDELNLILRTNKIPIVRVEGTNTKTGKHMTISGEVSRTECNWDSKIFSFHVISEGKEWSVGGMEAIYEDISGDMVEIRTKSP